MLPQLQKSRDFGALKYHTDKQKLHQKFVQELVIISGNSLVIARTIIGCVFSTCNCCLLTYGSSFFCLWWGNHKQKRPHPISGWEETQAEKIKLIFHRKQRVPNRTSAVSQKGIQFFAYNWNLDGQNRQSPVASVQRTRSTLVSHSAVPRGTNVKRVNANRVIQIATQ